ncbi:hypothetical protein ACTJJ4_07630 [Microbacterium sp. 22195]|uniref:hypothetical protein n=1 Tax=Microbacterium sp. 22195 TaxID=3453891 RepID=UPI003F8689AB
MTLYLPAEGEKVTAMLGAELDGMVTGMYGVVQWIDDTGEQRIGVMVAPGQTQVVSQGLLTVANAIADTELTTFVMEGLDMADDDDGD